MEKRVKYCARFFLGACFFALVFSALVSASNHTLTANTLPIDDKEAVNKAYQCLENQVKNKTSFSLEQAVFAALALGSKSNLQDALAKEKKSGESCWPGKGCSLKETALAALAYQRTNKNSKDIEQWLNSKSANSNDLIWYLEIDIPSKSSASCSITIDGQKRTVTIKEDMKIGDNGAGSCFSVSSSGYWLQVKPSCLDKSFDISCDQDFLTSLAYEQQGGSILYVVSDSHASVSLGTTTEKINGRCFKIGANCDYEGSLWSALALYKAEQDISAYVPYLLALSESNKKYFPSAFLYILLGGEDYYAEILQQQKQSGYWEIIGSPYKRYYDTSLAMLALNSASASSSEVEKPKSYLLQVQTKEGCWNQRDIIVDTGFILYSGWHRAVNGGGGGGSTPLCEEVIGQSCEIGSACTGAGGRILNNFYCSGFGVCCSIKVQEQSCSAKQGSICASNEQCAGREETSLEGACCVGECAESQQPNTCETSGGLCASFCDEELEQENNILTCSDNNVCCIKKEILESRGKVWIFLLITLIILVILAIIFKHKLQLWWFNFRRKGRGIGGLKPASPPPGYGQGQRQPLGRSIQANYGQRPMMRPVRMAQSAKDKELEETLKKLRDMGK